MNGDPRVLHGLTPLSLTDALPIVRRAAGGRCRLRGRRGAAAVVLVEAAALERDADAAEHLAQVAPAGLAGAEGIVGEGLHDREVLTAALAPVLVGGHARLLPR